MADLQRIGDLEVKIVDPTTQTPVTATTILTKQCLDVNIAGGNVSITSDDSPTKYQLKTAYDATGISVATTPDTTLYSFTGQGVIDLVAVNSAISSNWGIVIVIDGTERLRISMSDLGSVLALSNSDFDLVAETANKQFRWHPNEIGFQTGFAIKAYSTTGTQTLTYLVMYREKVV